MKGLVLIVGLVITLAQAKFDVRELFDGKEVFLGRYNTSLTIANVTAKQQKKDSEDEIATNNAIILIHLLRRMFGVGIYPLPPLDPYKNKNLKSIVVDENFMLSGKLHMMSVTFKNAKKFKLNNFELQMKTGRIDFDVSFPTLNLILDFQSDMLFGHLIPVIVSGQLRVTFDDLNIFGALQAEPRQLKGFGSKTIYQVVGAHLQMSSQGVNVTFVGLNLENDLLQSIDRAQENQSFTKWMIAFWKLLEEAIVKGCLSQMNNVLRGLSISQVRAFLLPEDDVQSAVE